MPAPTDVRFCKACEAALFMPTTVAAGILPGFTGAILAAMFAVSNKMGRNLVNNFL